jgi:hypothetical protein
MAMLLMLLKLKTTENSRLRTLPSRGGAPPASVLAKQLAVGHVAMLLLYW